MKLEPQTQWVGVEGGCQPYRKEMASTKALPLLMSDISMMSSGMENGEESGSCDATCSYSLNEPRQYTNPCKLIYIAIVRISEPNKKDWKKIFMLGFIELKIIHVVHSDNVHQMPRKRLKYTASEDGCKHFPAIIFKLPVFITKLTWFRVNFVNKHNERVDHNSMLVPWLFNILWIGSGLFVSATANCS